MKNVIKSNTVSVDGQIMKSGSTCFALTHVKETEKAIMFNAFTYDEESSVGGSDKQVWLPKSQVKQIDSHVIDMPMWLFVKTFNRPF